MKESGKKVWKSDNEIMRPYWYGEFLTAVVSRYRYKCDAVLPWRKVIVAYSPKVAVGMCNEIHERVKETKVRRILLVNEMHCPVTLMSPDIS